MPPPRGLVQQLDQQLHQSELLPRRARLLIGVSGGADSVALLRLAHAINQSAYWRWELIVGHIDHGIRGPASAEDAAFVRRLARELGLGFAIAKLRLPREASEDTARRRRWAALKNMAKRRRCTGIVTAHHADDQAETVLMRIMRGCGLEGLAGIPPLTRSGAFEVYRPLLNFPRAILRQYLCAIGQEWREDETNTSARHTRNRVRGELLPLMESMYGGATEALVRLSKIAAEVWEHVSGEADDLSMRALQRGARGRTETHDRSVLRGAPPLICAEVLRKSVRRLGGSTELADFARIREAVRVVQGTHGAKRVELGRGVVLRVAGKRVVVGREPAQEAGEGMRWLLLIIAAAIGLRIVPACIHPLTFPDSLDYASLARAILHGQPYEVNGLFASRMPGYPGFVAAVYAAFGVSDRAVLIVQAFMGGAIVYMTYLLARRAGEVVGLLAATLAAVDPLSIGFGAALLSETPFTLMLLLGLWLCLRLIEDPHSYQWPLLGVVWAAAVYLRAEALLCIIPLGLFVWLKGGKPKVENGKAVAVTPRFSFFHFLVSVVVVLILLLPWQIRNYRLFHCGFFRLTTLEGISLYEAVYPGATGGPQQDKISLPPEMLNLSEAQRNDEWSKRGWHYVFAEPGRMASLAVKKIARTWSVTLNAGEFQDWRVQLLLALWHIPLFLFAIFGLLAPGLPSKIKGLLLIPLLYFTLVHALFLGSVRYRVPVMPLLCIFAASGITYLVERMRRGKPVRSSTV